MRLMQSLADAATKRKRRELLAITVAVRHSQGTDMKVYKEFVNSLQED